MKKFFAAVMAVAMVASMAATSFAAPVDVVKGVMAPKTGTRTLNYDDEVYLPLMDAKDNLITDRHVVEGAKIKAVWTMGADILDGNVELVKEKATVKTGVATIDGVEYTTALTEDTYVYCLKVSAKDLETTSDTDVVGTITLNIKKDSEKGNNAWERAEVKDLEIPFEMNVKYGKDDANEDAWVKLTSDNMTNMIPGNRYRIQFSKIDDEVELNFGSEPNEGTFTVDASGQGKVSVLYTTDANEALLAANPNAIVKFHNFNNVAFNRFGELVFEINEGDKLYELKDGKAVLIPTAVYDGDEVSFNTRVLGSYAISNVELVSVPAVVETPAADVTNPSTGVNA